MGGNPKKLIPIQFPKTPENSPGAKMHEIPGKAASLACSGNGATLVAQ
jgi:hypothetical protein